MIQVILENVFNWKPENFSAFKSNENSSVYFTRIVNYICNCSLLTFGATEE